MSDESAGRAETPESGHFRISRKRFWLAAVGLAALVVVPGAAYVAVNWIEPVLDDMATTIMEAGFDPLTPPNRLRGPGALYVVDGKSYRKVCDVDPKLLTDRLQTSPVPDRVRTRLEKGGFSLGGDYLAKINGQLGGNLLRSVEYRLTNVAITEIAMSDLFEIQQVLLSEPSCQHIVGQLVRASKQVCAGYAALSANTSCKVNVDKKIAAQEEAKLPVLETVKSVIQQKAGSEISIHNADELKGDGLYYGIQLSQLCITPDTATEPSVLTQTPQALANEPPGLIKTTAAR
ncbi:MAG: hypothetical protein WAL02_12035 [Rhodoplanes sp.]